MKYLLTLLISIILTKTTFSQPKQNASVTLPVDGWQTILSGLGKLPLESSQEIYMAIVSQVNAQIAIKDTKKPAPTEKPKNDSTGIKTKKP